MGTSLEIIPDMEGKLGHLAGRLRRARLTHIGGLASGTSSGKPSVAVVIEAEDGTVLLGETTLALLLTAVDALKAIHGDPR